MSLLRSLVVSLVVIDLPVLAVYLVLGHTVGYGEAWGLVLGFRSKHGALLAAGWVALAAMHWSVRRDHCD